MELGALGVYKAAIVLSAFLIGMCGTGRTATARSMRWEIGVQAADKAQASVWLRIIAFTEAPVTGADVRVGVKGSQGRPLVAVHVATNQ